MRLIDADALLEKLGCIPLTWEYGQAVIDIYEMVKNEPTVEPKRGRWKLLFENIENGIPLLECSECGREVWGDANYCPECGAKMEGSEIDADD